jgi:hypothetical protein
MVDLLDAIGWSEQPDTPDRLPVPRSRTLTAWARGEAKDLLRALEANAPIEPSDQQVDAYRAFCALGVPEAV